MFDDCATPTPSSSCDDSSPSVFPAVGAPIAASSCCGGSSANSSRGVLRRLTRRRRSIPQVKHSSLETRSFVSRSAASRARLRSVGMSASSLISTLADFPSVPFLLVWTRSSCCLRLVSAGAAVGPRSSGFSIAVMRNTVCACVSVLLAHAYT